jgi:hypothetical protein
MGARGFRNREGCRGGFRDKFHSDKKENKIFFIYKKKSRRERLLFAHFLIY